jgi:hypothetical protein
MKICKQYERNNAKDGRSIVSPVLKIMRNCANVPNCICTRRCKICSINVRFIREFLFLSHTCVHTFLVRNNVNVRVMIVRLLLFFIRLSRSTTAAVERVKKKRVRPFSTLY